MSDLTKLPVTVITGFLGAGKTTLIRHLMQNPQGRRLAVAITRPRTLTSSPPPPLCPTHRTHPTPRRSQRRPALGRPESFEVP